MSLADEIQRLHELHQKGALTDEEFTRAKAAALAGASGDMGSGGAMCYKCGSPPKRACALCEHMFCEQHGGERWVWVSRSGSRHGARTLLTKCVICDDCTPDPAKMKRSLAFLATIFILALAITVLTFVFTIGWILRF